MRLRLTAALALACMATLLPANSGIGAPPAQVPQGFFGIVPQTTLTEEDARYMVSGGLESVRLPVSWGTVQPTRKGGFTWGGVDQVMEVTSRAGLRVLPFLYGTPRWLAAKQTTLPVKNATQRAAWDTFLEAAVARYGPGGEFWNEHESVGVNYEPAIPKPLPIRTWQIWNEANFFYFAFPVSPASYGSLVTASSKAIKAVDPGAKVVLGGLFGEPTAGGRRGMPASAFLEALYRYPGIKARFDGVALHPYAVDTEVLEELVEGVHEVTLAAHDRPDLYITELGWGSQNNFKQVAFEQGIRGQVRELRGAYGYLTENQRRLRLKGAYWFSWKDAPGACNFCDSVGLFRAGKKFRAKPAWHTFVSFTGGRARP
ncbi:MAG: beta-galactosidase [Thermoleophilia bacterium]|nr:beta-galactosidase [Thermoleophilia bacterium]